LRYKLLYSGAREFRDSEGDKTATLDNWQ